jgi:GT2 family glycosyltransferase
MIQVDSQRTACSGRTATRPQLVSAVIPTHNRADLLARAIRSVQRQTFPQLEIIVVDDASQDNTSAVVESFGDPRIRYIRHDTNRGDASAQASVGPSHCGRGWRMASVIESKIIKYDLKIRFCELFRRNGKSDVT